MALTTSKLSRSPSLTDRNSISRSCGTTPSFESSIQLSPVHPSQIEHRNLRRGRLLSGKLKSSKDILRRLRGKPLPTRGGTRGSSVLCFSTGTPDTEATECARQSGDSSNRTSAQIGEDKDDPLIAPYGTTQSGHCLAEACRFVQNDAKFVNERARNDVILLSRGIMRLDARARQDVAILSSEFLKLDARAREDTEKIDRKVKKKAECLNHIATILKNKAQSKLKTAADQHWSDGALELVGPIDILAPASKHLINFNPPRYVDDIFGADLRLADFRAKQRALEDSLMALEFIKNIHDRMVSKMYKFPLLSENDSISSHDVTGCIMLEKNGKTLDSFLGEVSADRISAIQGAYWSMASALSKADGIDYTDPEELELLVATLIDLDAMDGKSSVSLLAECSSSPDVSTRRALANALARAPSMWTLGNAGMGALQRLAQDSNPSIATAASKAMYELKKQWEIEEGDNWRFTMDKDQKVDDADT